MRSVWFVVLGLLSTSVSHAQPSDSEGQTGPTRDFNDYVVKVIEDTQLFPRGGEYGGATDEDAGRGLVAGVTRKLSYGDPTGDLWVMQPLHSGATNCSGVTFQVFFEAYSRYAADMRIPMLNGMSKAELRAFIAWWFRNLSAKVVTKEAADNGEPPQSEGPSDAVDRFGLGKKITNVDDARPGDFMHWGTAESTTGHTVVFLGWVDDQKDLFRYFSSNSSEPQGIQVGTKSIGSVVDWWVVRVIPPPYPPPPTPE